MHSWLTCYKAGLFPSRYTAAIRVNNGFGRSVISHSEFDCHVAVQYWNAIDNHLNISQSSFKGSALDIRLENVTSNIEISDIIFPFNSVVKCTIDYPLFWAFTIVFPTVSNKLWWRPGNEVKYKSHLTSFCILGCHQYI